MAKATKRKTTSKSKPSVKDKGKPSLKSKSKPSSKSRISVNSKTVGKLRRAMQVHIPPDTGAVVLDRLWSVVLSRRDADPSISHSARLLSRGTAKVAQKFGEEAVECLIEAVRGDKDAVIAESADVLYHLLVVWVSTGVAPEEVWAELMRREGVSGIAEKTSRAQTSLVARVLRTTKIP
jgi:phosphoribosyl-ATP pyrophosphohydrolase